MFVCGGGGGGGGNGLIGLGCTGLGFRLCLLWSIFLSLLWSLRDRMAGTLKTAEL